MELQLLKPGSLVPMATQFINRIRVWGIGLENERSAMITIIVMELCCN